MKKVTNFLQAFLIICCLVSAIGQTVQAAVKYVKPTASGTGDGSSWANASDDLQAMINAAASGDEVWVAAGTYKPTNCNPCSFADLSISFVMKNNLAILGGFPNTGNPSIGDRDWTTNVTILSGNIGNPNTHFDNSYHVINNNNNGLDNSAVLDGFTITSGNANGFFSNRDGGGMFNSSVSPTLTNCSFVGNFANYSGGGISNNSSSPLMTNCSFSGNSASVGGGIYNSSSPSSITNCTFSGNSASFEGGGVYNLQSSLSLTNCSFSGNSAPNGGGMFNNLGSPTVDNCIFWGNGSEIINANSSFTTANYCIIQGGCPVRTTCTNVLDTDPLFVSQPGDLHLQPCSPAKDAGTAIGAPATDFDGDSRPLGAGIDLGFDENGETCCPAGNIIYVNQAATGNNNGTTWEHAFTDLQDALNSTCPSISEIWVAAGTYKPTTGTDRSISFSMKNNLGIYGGFAGGETMRSQRDWTANVTTLSGDIDGDNTLANNSYHVISNDNNGLNGSAVLDGFTITGGNADTQTIYVGAGMNNISSSPTVTNCFFTDNSAYYGGGIYNLSSSPTVTDCLFSGNSAGAGGGVYNYSSSPTLTNCSFSGNSAAKGGGIYTLFSPSTITNCSFSGNSATSEGGGVYNIRSALNLTNCSLSGNYAPNGGGMFNERGTPTVDNCIFWGNGSEIINANSSFATANYCIIQGGCSVRTTCTNVLDTDPLFVSQPPISLGTSGDLHLQSCSPAKDVGTAIGAPLIDIDGDARPLGTGIDMGFDENGETCCPAANILYVNQSATGNNNGSTWEHAFTDLQDALNSTCPGITEIWVAAGTYKPTNCNTCSTSDRSIYFVMKNNLAILGGFPNTGSPGIGDRDWTANVTTLSGDIDGDNTLANNSYHVISNDNNGLNGSAVLDGFTVTGGNANGPSPKNSGGGMFNRSSSPTVTNCFFTGNSANLNGGGIFNLSSSPIVTNCFFTGNSANNRGGGIFNLLSPSTITNCLFSGNSANSDGGGVYNNQSPSTITNCSFSGNSATSEGGGVYNVQSALNLTNCSFSGNSAPNGGGIFNNQGTPTIDNCIFWGNGSEIINANSSFATANYCIIQGGCPVRTTCSNVMDTDPLFISQPPIGLGTSGDLRLQECSPAIDAGTDAGAPANDLDGNARPVDAAPNLAGNFDLGAFEFQGTTPSPTMPTCTANLSFSLNGSGSVIVTAGEVGGNSTGCGDLTYLINDQPNLIFDCNNTGNQIVTLKAVDAFLNTATTSCQFSIVDDTPPTAVCPANIPEVALDNNGSGTLPANIGVGNSTDNCTVTETSPTMNFSCSDVGIQMVELTVTDGTNTVSTNCSFNVVDNVKPVINCLTTTVQLDATGNYMLTQNDVYNGASDNCTIINFDQMTPTAVSCADAGKVVAVLVEISDAYGNKATCTANVTVLDPEAPVAVCPANIPDVVLDANGIGTLPANIGDGSSTDNCTVTETSPLLNLDCSDVGVQIVDLTVTDGTNTVTATCSFNVVDNTLPTPTCLNPTVQLDATGNYTLTQNDVYGGGIDNCTTVNFWKMTPTAVDCSQAGTTVPVLVEVFDASGNQASCTANVTVEDAEAPVAICPTNIPEVVLDGNGNGSLPANIGDGSSTDNCSATETSPAMTFNCSAGPQMVTLTVTDGFNTVTANCSFNVVDNQAPVAHCPVNIPDVQLDANGNGTLPANIGDGSSTDNCTATETSPAISFTCADVGIQTVVLTASDGTNNSTINCSFNVVDNVLPTANCVSQTIQATLDANAQYTVDPNQLNENSTDACGILSLAASPAVLDCQHEGTNTVTLTVTDSHGNTASCTATIEVAEFLTLNPPTATAESCLGAGDGTVSITATAGGGQVKYSIDGGATYQPSGTFGNLSPGTYTIVVKVFGVPAICEKTATATVAAGGSPTTWFKDMDGDGYTDGTTMTSCAQPSGYVSNASPGDCDDNDPLVFPGQIWYEDLDGDGYGSGVWLTACQRPAGCFLATELAATDTDCDDKEATVFPLAAEVCDGLDNDCNGQIDEGLTGTYVGNVLFTTQAQLDAWLACYDVIQGSVTIQGGNITDLTPLSNIVEITGNLMILMNTVLTSLDGLENLADVGGSFYLYYNFQLSDCCAVSGLLNNGGVAGTTLIFYNKVGCNSQTEIITTCNPASIVGSGYSNGFAQACSDCIPQGVLTVFPNPTSAIVNVKWTGENPSGTVQLTDLLGRVLMEQEMQSRNEFNVSKLGSGIYLVRVKVDGHKQQVERVVVER